MPGVLAIVLIMVIGFVLICNREELGETTTSIVMAILLIPSLWVFISGSSYLYNPIYKDFGELPIITQNHQQYVYVNGSWLNLTERFDRIFDGEFVHLKSGYPAAHFGIDWTMGYFVVEDDE